MNLISDSEIKEIVQRVLQQSGQVSVPSSATQAPSPSNLSSGTKVVAIGADHGGFEMKTALIETLKELKYEPLDCGTFSKDAVDYPDFALAVAEQVRAGKAWRGIMIDGAGIGSCMVANKVPGVRAAACHTPEAARNSREHNFANVLTLGGRTLSPEAARDVVKTWLDTPWGGERHERRIRMLQEIERKYLKE